MESVYNKTFTPLNAGHLWKGRSEVVDTYNVACVSCASDTNGLLSLLQSQNDINYDFAGLYDIVGGTSFNVNEKLKAKYFRVMFENTSETNQTYLRLTTFYKNDVRDDLSVNVTNAELSCILSNVDVSGGALNVNVVSGGGGSGGGLVQVQGYSGTNWENITSSSNKLNVTDSATTSLNNKIFNSVTGDTEAIKVYTVNSSGGALEAIVPSNPTSNVNVSASTYTDGSGVVHYPLESQSNLFAFNSSSGNYESVGITTTGSLLKTQACVHTATGQDISGTVINLVRGLNIYDVGQENLGSYGNIANNITLTSVTAGTALNINNSYMNESVLVYEDTSTTLTTSILVQVSNDNTNWQTLTALYPVVGESTKRFSSSKLCLKAFKYIRLYNNGVASYTNIICSLYSS